MWVLSTRVRTVSARKLTPRGGDTGVPCVGRQRPATPGAGAPRPPPARGAGFVYKNAAGEEPGCCDLHSHVPIADRGPSPRTNAPQTLSSVGRRTVWRMMTFSRPWDGQIWTHVKLGQWWDTKLGRPWMGVEGRGCLGTQGAGLLEQLWKPRPASPRPLPALGRSRSSRKKGAKGKRGETDSGKGAVARPRWASREGHQGLSAAWG